MNGKEAQLLIVFFEAMKADRLVMAGGSDTGCNWRAHLIGEKWQKATGLAAEKAWFWGDGWMSDRRALDPSLDFMPSFSLLRRSCAISPNYHTAAVIHSPGGQTLAIDPVYYNGPVTLDQFKGDFRARLGKRVCLALSDHNSELYFKTREIRACKEFNLKAHAEQMQNNTLNGICGSKPVPKAPGRSRWLITAKCTV